MKRKWNILMLALIAVMLLSGCTMRTVDEMYCLPKRSEEYNNLQSAIDTAMTGREYCAPLTGENQQTVQQADLDGDGTAEYLLFAKGGADKPLQILIFRQEEERYVLSETLESNGTAFDQVEYVQMDSRGGVELIVGRQVSDQVLRSVSVYTFKEGLSEQLLTTNYTEFLTCDLDEDSYVELMLLRPGLAEQANGVAVLYGVENGAMERSAEANMSMPVENLKRIITGSLHGSVPAVFVGSTVEGSAIITDVYALLNDTFTNVSFSNESGTSVQTLRNHYVYADDIDNDGVVELPDLITMRSIDEGGFSENQHLIRWYAMRTNGSEVDKMYTFHNFVGGWYLQLDKSWAERVTVEQAGSEYRFYLWNRNGTEYEKVFTVYAYTGNDREEKAVGENRFIIYRSDSTLYAGHLEVASGSINISQEDLINGFSLIHQDWKTGET